MGRMGSTDTPEVLFVKIARKSHFIMGRGVCVCVGSRVLKACWVPCIYARCKDLGLKGTTPAFTPSREASM